MARGHVVTVAVLISTAVGLAVSVDSSPVGALGAVDRIAAGDSHTCAISDDGNVWCWGDNGFGQLGNSGFPGLDSPVPVRTSGFGAGRTATQIVAGSNHTCALANDASVWCWGSGGFNQLSNGGTSSTDPVQVTLGTGITASRIFAGGSTTCALTSDTHLTCWGRNTKGQIGNGTTQASGGVTPTAVTGIPASFTVADVEVGDLHVCAVATGGGAVHCWGNDLKGQLGTVSDASLDKSTPTQTDPVSGTVRSVSAGTQFTCVTLTDRTASCWGNNANGQLGRGSTTPLTTGAPAATSVVGSIDKVVTGTSHACALMTAGTVQCWGSSASGQVGNGTTGSNVLAPSAVTGLAGTVLDLAVGANHACAVIVTGAVQCWGANAAGQLGVNDQTDRAAAATVSSLTVSTTTTTAAPASTAGTTPAAPATSPTIAAPTTSTTSTTPAGDSQTTALAAGTSRTLTVKRLRTVTAARIAAAAGLSIPRKSQGTMRISITSGTTRCRFVGSSVRGTSVGTCRVRVVMVPRTGRVTTRYVTVKVVR
ncbi:MAG: hypothetical protein EBS32_04485 [Actinobacteria bacterium]|nr:hypothetical protein [Actinomycetota bacterium]